MSRNVIESLDELFSPHIKTIPPQISTPENRVIHILGAKRGTVIESREDFLKGALITQKTSPITEKDSTSESQKSNNWFYQ